MKIKNKKKNTTTLRSVVISIGIILFIAVIGTLYFLNDELERTDIINAYRNQQAEELAVMRSVIIHLYDDPSGADKVNLYLSSFPASGSRFLVYVVNGEVVFAKNTDVTSTLGSFRSKTEFFKAIEEDDLCIVTDYFNVQGRDCELTVVSTEDLIFDNLGYETTNYYSFVIVAILMITLLIMVEYTVIAWDRVEKKYGTASEELKKRNSELEVISQSMSDSDNGSSILDPDGIANEGSVEFYNVYTMKALLEKSDDPELLPLHMIKIQVDMTKRNFSRDTMYQYMGKVKDSLTGYEVMGEIKKGLFLIYIFRAPYVRACSEFGRIKTIVETTNTMDFGATVEMIEEKDMTPIEIFEELLAR